MELIDINDPDVQFLHEFILSIEPIPDETITASGVCVVGVVAVGDSEGYQAGTGRISLPGFSCAGYESGWSPNTRGDAAVFLPALSSFAATPGYAPGYGACTIPRLEAAARSEFMVLPALVMQGTSGLSRTASGECALPALRALSLRCALTNGGALSDLTPSDVIALLCQGKAEMAELRETILGTATAPDYLAWRALRVVSQSMTYATDDSTGYSDSWACALLAVQRAFGDCEDGAILLQALLLDAGVPAHRLVTCFGLVGADHSGHAWTCYKRMTDERWVVLEWTAYNSRYAYDVDLLPLAADAPWYNTIQYTLTSTSFAAVNKTPAAYFAVPRGDGAATLPLPVAEGATGPVAAVAAALPTLSLAALSGSRGAATLPAPSLSAAGECPALTHGDMAMPAFALSGAAGAHGALSLALPQAVGTAASGVRGAATLPMPVAAGAARADGVGVAAMALPMPRLAARAGAQAVAVCDMALPMWRVVGRGHAGGVGRAALEISMSCAGVAFEDLTAAAACDWPLPVAAARGRNGGGFAGYVIRYREDARW